MKRLFLLLAILLTVSARVSFAQTRVVSGRVLDEAGQGLPSVGISVKGTQTGTVTDLDGKFQLNVPEGSNTLVVQVIGYRTQEVPVSSNMTIRMQVAAKELT